MSPDDIECVDVEDIRPVHEPRDRALFDAIAQSMERSGWLGRPLLVVALDDGTFQALTGSHRLGAAKEVDLATVPVLIVDDDDAAIIMRSRDFPRYPPGVAQHLFEHDRSWLGRYILLDGWLHKVDRPWLKKHLDALRELGHEDLVPIVRVRAWGCATQR